MECHRYTVAAPDGTREFFCRNEAVGQFGWLGDFLADREHATSFHRDHLPRPCAAPGSIMTYYRDQLL
jgi:hypothetical protein